MFHFNASASRYHGVLRQRFANIADAVRARATARTWN